MSPLPASLRANAGCSLPRRPIRPDAAERAGSGRGTRSFLLPFLPRRHHPVGVRIESPLPACLLDPFQSLCHWASTPGFRPDFDFASKCFAASQLRSGLILTPTGLTPASQVQLCWTHSSLIPVTSPAILQCIRNKIVRKNALLTTVFNHGRLVFWVQGVVYTRSANARVGDTLPNWGKMYPFGARDCQLRSVPCVRLTKEGAKRAGNYIKPRFKHSSSS